MSVSAWSTRTPGPGEAAPPGSEPSDPVTGLGGQARFTEAVERALQAGEVTLLLINLDRFKSVNDTLGRPAGDALLGLVARRLLRSTRPTEGLFRLGGDEFAVLPGKSDDPEALAARLVDVLGRPYLIAGQVATIGASIGVARGGAGAAAQAATLLRHADLALHSAKSAGRHRWHAFEPSMADQADARRQMETDVRKALKLGQFKLVYQPQLHFATGALSGAEALLRWHHPECGLIPPDTFIPVAEDSGAITAIGEWVLRTACRDALAWPGAPRIAVNVSPVQFDDADRLVSAIDRALAASGLPADRLEIEITESAMLRHDQGLLETLSRLRARGIRIAMDDFGTGFSSLSQLVGFPFDKIKIDQSFVRGPAARANGAVVRAIAALGSGLGMATIAEGVETEAQAALVQSYGCTDMQGYLVSRPVCSEALADLLRTFRGECTVLRGPPS